MKHFFTIITVCLNSGKNLNLTIDSILKQSFKNYEIIIKDGNSTDGSFDGIPLDNHIVKVQKNDTGIYDAMNQALILAKGEYILFLNAGDYFYDDTVLELYSQTILNNNLPDLVYCNYITTGLNIEVQSPPVLSKFYLFKTMLCHQVCMIKKEAYDKLGFFDIKYKVDADYDFLLRLLIDNKSSYKHFQKLGIISTSGGFSSQHFKLALQEAVLIRKSHFRKNYFYYNLILLLTFPSIRIKLSKSRLFSKIYRYIVNYINKF